MDRQEAFRSALVLLAAHNVAQNTVLNQRGYVAGNLVVTAAMVAMGKTAGLSRDEMGLTLGATRTDLRRAAMATGATAVSSLAALAHPSTREFFRDDRALDSSLEAIALKALVRFPVGTALFEEVTFRGVLPALSAKSTWNGDLISAVLFGLWHVVPTARILPGSPLGQRMTLRSRSTTILAGCAASAIAGLVFSRVRRLTGTIMVPWLLHAGFNTITYLAGVIAWRVGNSRSRTRGSSIPPLR